MRAFSSAAEPSLATEEAWASTQMCPPAALIWAGKEETRQSRDGNRKLLLWPLPMVTRATWHPPSVIQICAPETAIPSGVKLRSARGQCKKPVRAPFPALSCSKPAGAPFGEPAAAHR